MIVTIFGATGMVGTELVRACKAQGYHIRAFGRNVESLIDEDLRDKNFETIKGYVFDEEDVLKALRGTNAVLSALGGAVEGTDRTRSLGMKNIVNGMTKAGITRIVAIGGMGLLDADEDGALLMDTPEYPQQYVAVAKEHLQAYQYLKGSNTRWTFVCPPDILQKPATGLFTTKAQYPTGSYQINAGDLALFMVKELTDNRYVHQKVGIGNTV